MYMFMRPSPLYMGYFSLPKRKNKSYLACARMRWSVTCTCTQSAFEERIKTIPADDAIKNNNNTWKRVRGLHNMLKMHHAAQGAHPFPSPIIAAA
eukprot:1161987-Pelagomonas_calceolata.AAC.5